MSMVHMLLPHRRINSDNVYQNKNCDIIHSGFLIYVKAAHFVKGALHFQK